MLVRRQVGRLLADYYAQPSNRVVGSVLSEGDVNFKSLWGEWHYRRLCARLYAKQEGRWLTSVELMRPFYSRAIANFVAAQSGQQEYFDVVEMGGGRGTNASLIMSHLQRSYPEIYERLNSYTMIDASPSLLDLQQETMRTGEHFDKMNFELKDLMDVAERKVPFLTPSEIPTVALACELLDNLPHDKVRMRAGRLLEQGEVIVSTEHSNDEKARALKESFVPLKDTLLSRVLKLVPAYTRTALVAWIPTVACGVLDRLHESRPNASLMFADFDWLPPPDLIDEADAQRTSVWAPGEPIVTDMEGIDHECYLQSPDHCDILFPTDFPKLASYVKKSWNLSDDSTYQVHVHKQSDFLERYGPSEVEATQSWLTGFTPMLYDFANCSALTVTRRQPDRLETNPKMK